MLTVSIKRMQFLKHSLLPIKSKSDEIWVSDEDHFNRAFNTFLLIKNPSTWAKLLNWFEIQSHASMCNYRKQSFTVLEKVLKTCFLCVLLLLDMKFKLRTHSRHSLKEKSVMLAKNSFPKFFCFQRQGYASVWANAFISSGLMKGQVSML